MLDEHIINWIKERENKKERRDTGWQPIPLYKELELPQQTPQKKEKSPSGPIEIDVWGPEADHNVIQTSSYGFSSLRYFS